jgi:N-acyl-L-homoserine lactone synthetase
VTSIDTILAEGRSAIPTSFMTKMKVNRAIVSSFAMGDEFVDRASGLDVFDDDDALYVIAFDRWDGAYLASGRLRPTMGPNMLRDALPYLLDFGETIESPCIWELSRLCAMTNRRASEGGRHSVDAVVGAVLAAAVAAAERANVTQIVCVTDDAVFDTLVRVGCAPKLRPRPALVPNVAPHVAFLDVGEVTSLRIRKARQTIGKLVSLERRPTQ